MRLTVLHKTDRYQPESSFTFGESVVRSGTVHDDSRAINENDFVAFLLDSPEPLPLETSLWLSEVPYELSLVTEKKDGGRVYECLRYVELDDEDESRCATEIELEPGNRRRVQFAKIFLNQFGTCEVAVERPGTEPERLGEFEVIPGKIRPHEINNLFDYLLEQNVTLWQPFARVRSRHKDHTSASHHLLWLLKKVRGELGELIARLPLFRLSPQSRLVPYQEVVPWSDDVETTDSSLSWLMGNLSVLARTTQPGAANVRIRNRLYSITEVQVEYLREHTDVYENQLIHGYLTNIREVFSGSRRQLDSWAADLTQEVEQTGTLKARQLLRYYQKLSQDCGTVIARSETALEFFRQYVPVSFPRVEFPTRTEGFAHREHYHSLLRPMQEWFGRDGDLQLDGREIFSGTRSMDKLYELFCLFQLIEALESLGFQLLPATYEPSTEPLLTDAQAEPDQPYRYQFAPRDGVQLTLYYERLPTTHHTALWTRRSQPLRPDFVLEYRHAAHEHNQLLIFDAKCQTVESVRRFSYKSVIPKYLHGISRRSGGDVGIRGLFLLHPEDTETSRYPVESWHQPPYRWFDAKPALPAIGRIEVATAKGARNQLGEVIGKMFGLMG